MYTKADVQKLLLDQNTPKWGWVIVRAIEALYARQTADEQTSQLTKHHNTVGFNGVDSKFLSSLAQQIQEWRINPNPSFNFPLSRRQLEIAGKKVFKYAAQLADIANAKAKAA